MAEESLRLISSRQTSRPTLHAVTEEDIELPPTRPALLAPSTRIMLCGFLTVLGFVAGVAAQKHHDNGYLSPAAVARALVATEAQQPDDGTATSQVPHTDVPRPQ